MTPPLPQRQTAPAAPSDADLCARLRDIDYRMTNAVCPELREEAATLIESLAAQLAERDADISALMGWQKIAEANALSAKLAEARAVACERDAARYRWLREQGLTRRDGVEIYVSVTIESPRRRGIFRMDKLDAAIDAAIAGEGKA